MVDPARSTLETHAHKHTGHPIDPVRIETEDGRREYARLQQQLYETSLPLRKRVLETYDRFFALVDREG